MKQVDPSRLGDNAWTTKNGDTTIWRTMSIDHLTNAYHLLRRKAQEHLITATAERIKGNKHWATVMFRVHRQKVETADTMERYIKWRVTQQESEHEKT